MAKHLLGLAPGADDDGANRAEGQRQGSDTSAHLGGGFA